MDIIDIKKPLGEWLKGTGKDSDIVISSRIRLARNIAQFPFLAKSSTTDRKAIANFIKEKTSEIDFKDEVNYFDLEQLDHLDRQLLVERHLISRELAEEEGIRGVILMKDETASLMVNEEDHLRLQVIKSGFSLEELYDRINRLDDLLEDRMRYAFSSQFGYLTACPTNVGTGIRVSVMLHLPALVWSKNIEKIFNMTRKINLAVRGLYGEGTHASGDFYQISNHITLGKTEYEILDNVESVVKEIVRYERETRQRLFEEEKILIEDRVWRAYGLLQSARKISSEETMTHLSSLRMGINMGVVPKFPIQKINELFVLTQPAHLQKMLKKHLEIDERDIARATFIREKLSEIHLN